MYLVVYKYGRFKITGLGRNPPPIHWHGHLTLPLQVRCPTRTLLHRLWLAGRVVTALQCHIFSAQPRPGLRTLPWQFPLWITQPRHTHFYSAQTNLIIISFLLHSRLLILPFISFKPPNYFYSFHFSKIFCILFFIHLHSTHNH